MEWISEINMAFQHLHQGGTIYHGTHCMWCKLLGSSNNVKSNAKLPYLYPEPNYLHASQRSHECKRKWLVVDFHNESDTVDNLHQFMPNYVYKYHFDHSVEISTKETRATQQTVQMALQWLFRDPCQFYKLTVLSPMEKVDGDFWPSVQKHSEHLDHTSTLWIILDHAGQYRTKPLGLDYSYSYSRTGQSHIVRNKVNMKFGCTVLIWYLLPGDENRCSNKLVSDLWERILYEIIINRPGHASVSDVLEISRQVLSPLNLVPVLECNRILPMSDCFFGFPFLVSPPHHQQEEVPIPEEDYPRLMPTECPRTLDEEGIDIASGELTLQLDHQQEQ